MFMTPNWTAQRSASQEIRVVKTKLPEAMVSLRYFAWSSNLKPKLCFTISCKVAT